MVVHFLTRGTLQYRVLRAFKKAGLNSQRVAGVLVHGFRHTYTTELEAGVDLAVLQALMGHDHVDSSTAPEPPSTLFPLHLKQVDNVLADAFSIRMSPRSRRSGVTSPGDDRVNPWTGIRVEYAV